MTAASIRLLPAEPPKPRTARIPLGRARRWLSPLESLAKAYVAGVSGAGAGGNGLSGEDAGGYPAVARPVVSVFVTQRAYTACCAHAASDLENEVGGWLVGKWRADRRSGEQFIIVEAILPAPHTRRGSAYLTFTQDTQLALYDSMRARYPNKDLVGWYHTHPRMGVFLSSYDTWLHSNFFPDAYQVALVIEPYFGTGGFFIRTTDGRLDPRRYSGFYELARPGRHSVVIWRNLTEDASPEQGEPV
jgi:proteasome lid subunit RPN8/RPN11